MRVVPDFSNKEWVGPTAGFTLCHPDSDIIIFFIRTCEPCKKIVVLRYTDHRGSVALREGSLLTKNMFIVFGCHLHTHWFCFHFNGIERGRLHPSAAARKLHYTDDRN